MGGRRFQKRLLPRPKPVSSVPRCLRPGLSKDSLRDLGLAHHSNVDSVAKGDANEETLWQMLAGVITWCYVADKLSAGIPEMTAQSHLLTAVLERYRCTGKIGFSGAEYQLAKEGADVMDQLAEMVDAYTALQAAIWSEGRVKKLREEFLPQQGVAG